MGSINGSPDSLRYIAQSYNHADSQASALRLILTLNPHWGGPENQIEFVRFTDGITNTLLKIINRKPGLTEEQIDHEAVLMRAYGNHTEIIIDRERETKSHALLASYGLAPRLLARFQNGLLYRFIRGRPATHEDLVKPSIWRGVARRLAQWHAVLPISEAAAATSNGSAEDEKPIMHHVDVEQQSEKDDLVPVTPRQPAPNTWTVLQKWIRALPTTTDEQRQRRLDLQKELQRVVKEFDDGKGLGENGLVFAHCDLLCANVIAAPSKEESSSDEATTVHFIDYEYATPSPASFDIANHFAEWAGYDCDYNMVPTRSVRRQFLTEYVKSYSHHRGLPESSQPDIVDQLCRDVDRYRGIPGLYWGTWALIQAQISQIDFDYASYAELRLGEYYAWRREVEGTRAQAGEEMPLRERRWAQEA